MIEKEWTTKSGLKAYVSMTTFGTRNGYVEYTLKEPLTSYCYSINFDEVHLWTPELIKKQKLINDIEVHGGITFNGTLKYDEIPNPVVGFDCNHAWDAPDWEAADKLYGNDIEYRKFRDSGVSSYVLSDAIVRTLDYVVDQCESLATQLKALDYERTCNTCGDSMTEGYYINDGEEYYCSEECLFVDGYTKEQYENDYENGYIYYTEWED